MRFLVIVLLCVPLVAQAEIYKWTDAQGRVHFDQRAVAGATPVQVNPQVIESDDATRQRLQRTESFYNARRDEQAANNRRASQQEAEAQQRCGALRNELAKIPAGSTYYSVNDKGERNYFSDEQIDAARRQLTQQIAQDCD